MSIHFNSEAVNVLLDLLELELRDHAEPREHTGRSPTQGGIQVAVVPTLTLALAGRPTARG